MLHTAKTQPATFSAVCARLIPSDVKLTVEQTVQFGDARRTSGPRE
jgi:hypothetical protein